MRKRSVIACLLVLFVVGAGVAGGMESVTTPSNTEPLATDTGTSSVNETSIDEETSASTYSATVVITSNATRYNLTYKARVWVNRSANSYRIEYLREDAVWDVVVSNGSHLWAYDRNEGEVITTTALNGSFADEATDSVRPFYYDDFFFTTTDIVERLDFYHVRALGSETLQDRETDVLQLRPTSETPPQARETRTFWLDREAMVPVKVQIDSHQRRGTTIHRTLEYRNLSVDEPLDESRFTFDPPENATVTEWDARRQYGIAEPTLPADYQLVGHGASRSATIDTDNFSNSTVHSQTFRARYQNLTTTIEVENHSSPQQNATGERANISLQSMLGMELPRPENGSLTTVRVGSTNATTWSVNETTYVAFPCEDALYVASSELARSALIDIVQTIPCSADPTEPTASRPNSSDATAGTNSPEPASDRTTVAPGVTTERITDPLELLAAHDDALAGRDFVATIDELRTVRRENATSQVRYHQQFRHDANSSTYLATYRNESARDDTRTVVWGNGTTGVVRTTSGEHSFYEPSVAPSSTAPTGSAYLLSVLLRYDFAVEKVTNLTNPTRTKLDLVGERANVTATLVVDPSGRIHDFAVVDSSRRGGAMDRVRFQSLANRTVPRQHPGWVDEAPADPEIQIQLGTEIEPTYIGLNHHFGEPVPAGAVIELTTANGTYTTRIQEPLTKGDSRELYVTNGSLVLTTNREQARMRGRNLSSPVDLLIYTDEGVLVYSQQLRWTGAERPA